MVVVEHGDITDLIVTGQFEEGVELEAKRASGQVPRNAWESISAFANTAGGVLVLGLVESDDGWVVEGISNPDRMIQDIHSLMRDGNKISCEVSGNGDIWKEEVANTSLVIVRVRAGPRRHKPVYINGNRDLAYVRRNEGDARCTDNELDRMRREATPFSFDSQVIPYLEMADFNSDTIQQYRTMSAGVRPDLAHHRLAHDAFLQSIGAWRVDREAGTEGPTVAGILMFGEESAIREIRTNHVIDYRRIPVDESPTRRWTDRVQWAGNLFGGWQELFPRLARGLPMPFRLRGPQRVDQPAGLEALREAFVNLLVHTDYQESGDAVVLHRHDGYTFRNPGDSWVDLRDLGLQGRSDRRNPELAKMFDHVGLADRAGSGFIRILDEWRELGFRHPNIVSDPARYEFALELKLASMLSADDRTWLAGIGGPWREEEELALIFARHLGHVENQSLRFATGQHLFDASQTLRSLRDRDLLILQGSGRNTRYVLGPAGAIGHTGENPDHLDSNPDHLPQNPDHLDSNPDHLDPNPDQTSITSQLHEVADPIAQSGKVSPHELKTAIVTLCRITPLSQADLARLLRRSRVTIGRHTSDLLKAGLLQQEHEQSSHPKQRYLAVTRGPKKSIQAELDL